MLLKKPVTLKTDKAEGPQLFRAAAEILRTHSTNPLRLGGLWGSSQALAGAQFPGELKLFLTSDPEEAESFCEDLKTFGETAHLFPPQDSHHSTDENLAARIEILQRLRQPRLCLVSSLLALVQPIPDPAQIQKATRVFKAKQALPLQEFIQSLEKAAYTQKPFASRPGEFSSRGVIFDLFPLGAAEPVRIEIVDNQIESLRSFEPDTQRSKQEQSQFEFFLDTGSTDSAGESFLFEHLPESVLSFCVEPLRLEERKHSLKLEDDVLAGRIEALFRRLQNSQVIELQSLPGGDIDYDTRSVQALAHGMRQAGESLAEAQKTTPKILLYCRNEAEQKRLVALLAEQAFLPNENCQITIGSLSVGFRFPSLGVSWINHHELMGVTPTRRLMPKKRDLPTQIIRSFLDLNEGDLIVHEIHGVGKFLGTQRVQKGEGSEDHLVIEFAEESHLYVPASRIDLVQKYVGAGGVEPKLDKIGSGSFLRRKEGVQKALIDLAAELLEIQALRESREGVRYPPDDSMQQEFEAAFPFTDTEDQVSVNQEIKHDLESARPMDRLLCGDVGYGKTELAIRAAFKVVSAGKQVAVLVPTTILAEQHGHSFRERFADYPVEIASLSRFRSAKEQEKIVEQTKQGKIDILIGTHRLFSADIGFKDLGLVVIDEEQRFGVRHKEKLKQLRATVDVLTLTATPIPRTLHMSLVGIRDISSLTTPPPGRESVETAIRFREDSEFIRQAIRKELHRGGQVFFLHNRIYSIERTAKEIQDLVPEAKIGIGHGQMSEHELEEVMEQFVSGKLDLLVSTAIIESGLDIPKANTIFIDNAHLFGLSDLHQLRGRVGRWKYKAHCYLLIPRTEPLPPEAKARLKAIEELQDLGSGFAIAMRDLEIRGTGNILGPEQSGHIGAVGYDMYCRLLKTTVQRMRPDASGVVRAAPTHAPIDLDLGITAYLPDNYVSHRKTRLSLLRELDEIRDKKTRDQTEQSIRDRFGPLPVEAKRLLDLFWIKRALASSGIQSLHFAKDRLLADYKDRLKLTWALRPIFPDIRFVEEGKAHLMVPSTRPSAEKALDDLRKAAIHLEKLGT